MNKAVYKQRYPLILLEELAELMEGLGGPDPQDMMKSLNSLAKYNGGKFKSPAQAKFLYRKLQDRWFKPNSLVKQWARPYLKGPNDMAVMVTDRIQGFGTRTASKVRYYGFAFVVDGGGVVARAKLKVRAGRGKEADSHHGGEVIGVTQTTFERDGDAPTLYDAHGERKAKEARAQKNAPLISKIQAISTYQDDDFLQSIVAQLQTGATLSPGQERVLAQKMPYQMSSRDKYKELWAESEKILARIAKEVAQGMAVVAKSDSVPKRDKESSQVYGQGILDGWRLFKKRPTKTGEIGETSSLSGFVGDLAGWDEQKQGRAGGGYWTLAYLGALFHLATKGSKAPKWATKMARGGEMLAKELKKIPAGAAKRDYVSFYSGADDDPFAEFEDDDQHHVGQGVDHDRLVSKVLNRD